MGLDIAEKTKRDWKRTGYRIDYQTLRLTSIIVYSAPSLPRHVHIGSERLQNVSVRENDLPRHGVRLGPVQLLGTAQLE